MDNAFDTEINRPFHENVTDSGTLTVGDVTGGVVATVVDTAASLWNSLPFTPEANTSSLLKRISSNALKVYEENPEVIQTASLIGGSILPLGLSAKGLNLMRNGGKGATWWNTAGREADIAKVAKVFEESGSATKEYRTAMRTMYAKSAVNQAVDAVAMEAAFVFMTNAHPMMEDYIADPVKNFALSAAFGGVIGGGIGHIADRFALREATGAVAGRTIDTVFKDLRSIAPDMTNAVQLQSHDLNVRSLERLIQERTAMGKTETDDLVFHVAKLAKQNTEVEAQKLFESMISPEMRSLPKEELDVIKKTMIEKPEMFGVENVRLLTEKEISAEGLIKAPTFGLDTAPSLSANAAKTGPIVSKPKDAVYFPELNLYGTKSDAIHYAGASVLGKSVDTLAKELPYNYGKIPNFEASIELIGKSSAHVQAEYIGAIARVDKMTIKELQQLHISETDGALLNAVVLRMQRDPEAKELLIKTSDRSATYGKILERKTETLLAEGKLVRGPQASYTAAVDNFAGGSKLIKFDPREVAGVPKESIALLKGWIAGGGVQKFRQAAVDYFAMQQGGFGKAGADRTAARLFGGIYESPGSVALRSEFAKLADSDGNVFLYRGWQSHNIKGHAPVESYTTHVPKASEFAKGSQGHIRMYKVHVDDIVAGFSDIPGSSLHRAEIIVRAPARHHEAVLDKAGKIAFEKEIADGKVVTTTTTTTATTTPIHTAANLSDLQEMLIAQKADAIDSLLAQGIPLESIAIKTNTSVDAVKAYSLVKQTTGLDALIQPGASPTSLNQLKSYDDAMMALLPAQQPIVLSGNLGKNPYIQNHIGLNNKQMADMNKTSNMAIMASSKSEAARSLGSFIEEFSGALDIMKTTLGQVNNERAGTAFFNSFDFWARKMGEIGPIASAFGKQVQEIGNRMIKQVITPIEGAMTLVSKDPVALIEFNVAMDTNAGLAGWRMWTPEGKLMQKVEKVGEDGKKVITMEPVLKDGVPFQVVTPSVRSLLMGIQEQGASLRELGNTIKKIQGSPEINDIGFWAPSFNPVNKFIAYAHNISTDETKLIWGRTQAEFDESVRLYKKHLEENGIGNIKVYTKDEQEYWNMMNGRLDVINMQRADVGLQKSGKTASVNVKSDASILTEMAGGYEHYITSQMRNLADVNLSEITDQLGRMSLINRATTAGQPLDKIKKVITQPKDSAMIVRNTLIGNSNLGEYEGWKTINRSFETIVTVTSNTLGDIFAAATKPLRTTFLGGSKQLTEEAMKKIDYQKIAAEMKDRGIHNPWEQFDEATAIQMFGLSKLEDSKDTSKRLIYASNALAATIALRFGEIAQPLVNAMSLPILTSLAIADRMPASFMGVQHSTAKVSGVQIMYEGARAMNSPMYKGLNEMWEKNGYFTPMVSEASNVFRTSRKFEKGAIAATENLVDSSLVKMFSRSADYSETLTRKVAMNTGAVLAKRLYPELDDVGVTIFARDFMDKAIGNFHASQRPVFYQGTLGVALGLFQTYSLTLGQSIYRHLELKNYKQLGKTALLQSGIFGTQSLPGFDAISQQIGEHFSDDNFDLVTGSYRALGQPMANFMLYGLPSNLGPTISTRGDADPRLPIVNDMVAYNFVKQMGSMFGEIKKGLDADAPEMGRALLQSLSLQNMSRPLARTAEIATSYSINRAGETVQAPAEVWTTTGIFARILGTRPIEEQVLRDGQHLNKYYGAIDKENRVEVINKMRTQIRNGTLTDEKISAMADKYMKANGNPRGWQAAVNTAVGKTESSGRETFIEKLKPDNPINFMIDNLD